MAVRCTPSWIPTIASSMATIRFPDPFARRGDTFIRRGGRGARARLRAADTGALFWAGSATEWQLRAQTVEAAYRSGLRAASEARAALESGIHRYNLAHFRRDLEDEAAHFRCSRETFGIEPGSYDARDS